MSSQPTQAELFTADEAPTAATDHQRIFRGTNGVDVGYFENADGTLTIRLGGTESIVGTKESHGRYFARVPGFGKVQKPDKTSFLSALALIIQARAANEEAREANERAFDAAQKIITVVGAHSQPVRPREHNKLCKASVECAWPRERIIPQKQRELYAPLPLWLLCRPEPTPGEKLVYARLAFFAGNHGIAWASHSTIAREVGASRKQVIKILRSLANRHLIELDGTGRRAVERYGFLQHPWMREVEKCELTSQVPVTSVPEKRELSSHKKRYKKRNQNTESPERESIARTPARSPRAPAKIRAGASGEDSIRRQIGESSGEIAVPKFARDEDSSEDEVWRDLCVAVGVREMMSCGAMWKKRLKLTRRALWLAVSDWKAKTPAEKQAGGGNAAAYITAAYEREKRSAE